uniref:Uncharacterized protein n=1 Tax=Plectus sambesii TaxID=2011161 RepID=A0A914VZ35_9BILA
MISPGGFKDPLRRRRWGFGSLWRQLHPETLTGQSIGRGAKEDDAPPLSSGRTARAASRRLSPSLSASRRPSLRWPGGRFDDCSPPTDGRLSHPAGQLTDSTA